MQPASIVRICEILPWAIFGDGNCIWKNSAYLFFREKGFRIIRLFPSYLGGWIRGLATTSGRLLWPLGFLLL
jgi:hypothetical protein